ncbi:MAG: polysaccharide biosynthesis C-terminal domain-containing protein [Chitinophagaceae bacterium]|nr:polysaccharide biosynthesis C-terminal domain-containing protein [Chitinophagaceae bacterium]
MGHIRRQTILSSIIIYLGFAIGLLNTYLYVKHGTFTLEQYGLTRLLNDVSATFFSFGTLGVVSYIYKFHPFYKNNLSKKENDQLGFSLLIILLGFLLVVAGSIFLKPLFIRKFSERSLLFIKYYYWTLPFTLGLLLFTIFEAFAWFAQRSIFTNFLRETGLRLIQLILIICFIVGWINFDEFIKWFSFCYLVIALVLIVYLVRKNSVHFTFKISRVTKKFSKKIGSLMLLIYGGLIVNTLAQYIDSIIIASISDGGLTDVGIYTLATFIATTISVPQRSIISATVPVLSNSWKTKNYDEIKRIYNRTSINLLLLSLLIFFIIWLNVNDLFTVLNINKDFEAGKMVILILGISKIIDAGTGVNSQIIGTSNLWRFEVLTGVLLLSISIPLNYFLVKQMGINGSALSNLIAFAIYNAVRLFFIYRRFSMQPFTAKTVYAVLATVSIYAGCYLLLNNMHGWIAIFLRSAMFVLLFAVAVIKLRISPDADFLLANVLSKILKNKKID